MGSWLLHVSFVMFSGRNDSLTLARMEVRSLLFGRVSSWRCKVMERNRFEMVLKLIGTSMVVVWSWRCKLPRRIRFEMKWVLVSPLTVIAELPLASLESRRR
jgi:hypothetical protein